MRAGKIFTLTTLLFACMSFFANGQEAYQRIEIAAPLHPFVRTFENYYLQSELYVTPKRSWIATAGYKGGELWELFFRNGNYKGYRLDLGHRFYMPTEFRWMQAFATANLNLEAGKLAIREGAFVPTDSLQMKGVMIGPEINFGAKITMFKRVTLTTLVGYRHYFNTFNTDKITSNPSYWRYNDWDNNHQSWEENREYVDNFRKGRYPVVQINVGYVFGRRKKSEVPED